MKEYFYPDIEDESSWKVETNVNKDNSIDKQIDADEHKDFIP